MQISNIFNTGANTYEIEFRERWNQHYKADSTMYNDKYKVLFIVGLKNAHRIYRSCDSCQWWFKTCFPRFKVRRSLIQYFFEILWFWRVVYMVQGLEDQSGTSEKRNKASTITRTQTTSIVFYCSWRKSCELCMILCINILYANNKQTTTTCK